MAGSIKKRPNGVYRARYRDATGKEHARHFARWKDAQHWLNEQTAMIITGVYANPRAGKITVSRYFDHWIQSQVWADSTRAGARQALASSQLSGLAIGSVRPSHVRAWIKREHARGLSPRTLSLHLKHIGGMFKAAVRDRIIPTDPTEGIRPPREQRKPDEEQMIIPTAEEVRQLLDGCDQEMRAVVLLGAFSGLRRGEIAAANIGDVDFLRRRLTVARQAPESMKGECRLPKNDATRFVYLPDPLIEELSTLNPYEGGWLLPSSEAGRCPSSATLNHWWRTRIRRPAGVREELHLHSLRHFYASGLINRGADVVTVQRALGHASPTITLNVYSHLWPTAEDRTRDAAASIMSEVADSVRTVAV